MEITKREVIFSAAIVSVMLIIGFLIDNAIRGHLLEKYHVYDTAVQIESQEIFTHGMSTDIGAAFVYGNLQTLDPVSYPNVDGDYYLIEKKVQEYRKHTRTVTETYRDANGKTRTRNKRETYWTWDTIHKEEKSATAISFLDVQFAAGKIPFPTSHHISIVDTGYHKREVYTGIESSFTGTIFTTLKDGTINDTTFHNGLTISETIESLEKGHELLFFWIAWVVFTAGAVIGFYYLENGWLNK